MSEMQFNKIFAAILIAGLMLTLTGFFSDLLVHHEKLEEDAYVIEAPEDGAVATAEPKEEKPEPILAMIASASIEKGEKLSKACAACHTFDKGGANRVGPNLWGVVNRDIGGHEGFAYSDALASAEGVWDYQNLNAFMWKPKKAYPGTKMNYLGFKKPQDRADIIAWLRSLSASPAALPTSEEIAAEEAALGGGADGEAEEQTLKGDGADDAQEIEEEVEVEEIPAESPQMDS